MQMRDGFAGIGTVIDDEAKAALADVKLFGERSGFEEQMAKDLMIFRLRLGDPRNRFLGNDEHMNRCLRLDVLEGDDFVVFVENFGGDFAVDDFFKKGFAHDMTLFDRQFGAANGPAQGRTAPSSCAQKPAAETAALPG